MKWVCFIFFSYFQEHIFTNVRRICFEFEIRELRAKLNVVLFPGQNHDCTPLSDYLACGSPASGIVNRIDIFLIIFSLCTTRVSL